MRVKADAEAPRQQHSDNSNSGFAHDTPEAIVADAHGGTSAPALEGLPPAAGVSPPALPLGSASRTCGTRAAMWAVSGTEQPKWKRTSLSACERKRQRLNPGASLPCTPRPTAGRDAKR